jgi:hypothetical protein
MGYFVVFLFMFIVVGLVSWSWVEGIDYMHKNHPDYKGDDLFGSFDDNKNSDEESHFEGDF